MDATDRGFARRLADRIACVWRGHAWKTTEVTLGEPSLLRTDCAMRPNRPCPWHRAPQRRDDQSSGGMTMPCVSIARAGMRPLSNDKERMT